jgi:hypothetical protein
MASPDSVKKSPARKPYQRPIVTTYGRLRDLTTGGTGHANEPSSGQRPRP